MINRAEISKYRDRLQNMLRRLGGDRVLLKEEAFQGTGGEASGGISNVPVHPADLATHYSEETVNLGLVEKAEDLMEAVNLALARIEDGSFGRCQECGRAIPKERLNALPFTPTCVHCAQENG